MDQRNQFAKFHTDAGGENPFSKFHQADGQPIKPADTDGPLARGWKSVKSSVGLTADLAGRDTVAASERIRAQAEYQKANPGSEEGQGLMKAWREGDGIIGGIKGVAGEVANDYNNAKGFGAGAMSVGRNLQALGSGIVEQVPNMILPMAGMLVGGAAGSAAGPVGTAVGGFAGAAAGNSMVGTSEAAFRQLEKAGINPTDTAAVKAYLDKNGDSILGETAVKGAVIGAVDTATMGLSHALLSGPGKAAANKALTELGVDVADKAAVSAASKSPAFKSIIANDAAYQASQTGAQKVARNAAAGLAEPVGEFAGEYAGSYAATGEADAKDAFLEATSSLGQSGLTFAGQKLYQRMTGPQADAAPPITPTESGLSLVPQGDTATPTDTPSIATDADLIAQQQTGGLQRTYDPRAGVEPTVPLELRQEPSGDVPYQEPTPEQKPVGYIPPGMDIAPDMKASPEKPAKPFGQNFVMPGDAGFVEPPAQRPSVAMGLNPSAGPLSASAVVAVDSGASPAAVSGLGLQRRTAEPVDVQPIGAAAGQIGTPRRLGESPVIDVEAREVMATGQPLSLPAPTNLREGLARIRSQREQAARLAQQVPQPTQGALNGDQAQQAQTQRPQAQPSAGVAEGSQANAGDAMTIPDQRQTNLARFKARAMAGQSSAAGDAGQGVATSPQSPSKAAEQVWQTKTLSEREKLMTDAGLKGIFALRMAEKQWAKVPDAVRQKVAAALESERADVGATSWEAFGADTGTLDVPRSEMPQIKTAHRGAMTNFLNARGVGHEAVEVDPATLKPTQAEFSPEKVERAKEAGGDRSILISSDGHIIDGHHQAVAKLETGEPVKAIRLDAPAAELLPLVKEFPSATVDASSGAAGGPANGVSQEQAGQTGAVVGSDSQPPGGAQSDAAKPVGAPNSVTKPDQMMVGSTPGNAQAVTVKDGVVYVGKYEALNFETGDPVTVPKGSTRGDVAQALKSSGAMSRRQRVYGLGDKAGEMLYRRATLPGLFGRPLTHDAAFKAVQSVLKDIPNAPHIEVHRTPSDAGLSIPGPMPKGGVLKDGRIVVFSGANTGTLDVMRTVFHELFHRGLKSYFATNADYVKFMLGLATDHAVVRRGAEAWKKSADGQEKLASYSAIGPMTGERLANYEAVAVEESLATMSETLRAGSPFQLRAWTRSVGNLLEQIARFLGMARLANWIHGLNNTALDDFVNEMIARSGDKPRGGSHLMLRSDKKPDGVAASVPMFSRRSNSGNRLPDVVIGHKLGDLNRHPDYEAAKAGDSFAAARIAFDLVDDAFVQRVRDAASGADVIVPVVSVEATGRNKIPAAVADLLAERLGTEAEAEIVQVNSPKRTSMDGLDRLLNPPVFDGLVRKGAAYVLVDDTVTQGGTFASLASHIRDNGGMVSGLVALTGKQYSSVLSPSPELLSKVRERFDDIEPQFRAVTGYGFDALTESEARYLAKHDDAQLVRDRVLAAGNQTGNAGDASVSPRNSRSQGASSGLTADLAQKVVDGITARWANAPEVVVLADMQDEKAPAVVREYDAQQRSQGAEGEPEGFWYKGKAYIVAGALSEPRDVVRVLFHEALGHYGLRGTFGKGLSDILNQIAVFRKADVRAKAEQYGLDFEDPGQRLQAAEEVLAEMAETNPQIGFVRRAIAAIRAWLRTHIPGFGKMALTDDEIISQYLLPARNFVVSGGPNGGPGGVRLSRSKDQTQGEAFKRWYSGRDAKAAARNDSGGDAGQPASAAVGRERSGPVDAQGRPVVFFHGTRDDISQFDVGHPNRKDTGWLGWGIYGTSDPDIASLYASAKRGDGSQNAMPLYFAVVNPYPATLDMKRKLSRAPQSHIDQFTEKVKAQGHDGVMLTHPDGSIEIVAFEPTQVKSAIGNNGDFDPANPDIRFRRTPDPDDFGVKGAAADRWDAPLPSKWDDYVFNLQDKLVDLKRVTQSITKWSGKLADDINVYLQEELYHGRTAKRVQDFTRKELEPALRQLALHGFQLADLEEYMHARHAKEANRVIAERNPDVEGLQDGGSGMKDAEADAYFSNLPRADAVRLAAVAAKFDAIMAETNRLMVEYELEPQSAIDSWGKMFKHYVPLHREDKAGGRGTGQGFSIKGRETKGRTGSTRKVVDIISHIASAREKAVVRGEKNRVAKALVGLVTANPNQDFWKVGPPDSERVFNPKTGVVEERVNPLFKSLPNVVMAKVAKDGVVREVAVTFNQDNERAVRMAGALKNLDTPQIEGWLGTVSQMTRYFASINTQYNPVFGVVNLVRDVQGAMINLGATELADQKNRIAKDAIRALSGIYKDIRSVRKGGASSSEWSKLYEQFQQDGGQTGFRDLFATPADRTDAFNELMNPDAWAKSKLGKFFTAEGRLTRPISLIRKGSSGLFDWLSDYNEAMENGVRLAAYKAALDKGMTRQKAASLAKNLTVNFNRKGISGAQAGAVYAFFNAAMQGTARLAETLMTMEPGQPKTLRLTPYGKKVVYGGVLLGSVQALALAAAGFDDDEPPEFVRERNLIIPTGGKSYITIPMPLGLHVIPSVGRVATEFALGGFKNPVQRAAELAGLFADAFNPIGNAGLSMQTIAPTVLDPLVALTENKDWTGRPIARVSSNKDLPGFTQHKDSASIVSKFLAEAINTLSGGNKYVAGVLSPTPDQIDYLAGQLGGGVWRELTKVEQTITNTITGEDLPLHKVPLVGRFVGSADGQSGQGNAFYSNASKLNRLETEIRGLEKDGKFAEARELRMENPEARLIIGFNMAERRVQQLRREKSEMLKSDADAAQVNAVEQRITEIMSNMNTMFATAKNSAQIQ